MSRRMTIQLADFPDIIRTVEDVCTRLTRSQGRICGNVRKAGASDASMVAVEALLSELARVAWGLHQNLVEAKARSESQPSSLDKYGVDVYFP